MHKTETGRSMVEMLGTLAIIGVLSVGGIMGYSYGMDKYRANETINDIMLRSVDTIYYKNTEGNLNNTNGWPDKNSVGYITSFIDDDMGNVGIQIQGVSSRVCKMIGDTLKSVAEVYINNDNETSEDPCDASEENTMEFYVSSQCSPKCDKNEVCDNGLCISTIIDPFLYLDDCKTNAQCGECAVCQNKRCYATSKQTTFCSGGGTCYNGICEQPLKEDEGCSSNSECGSGQYCASPNTSPTEAFPEGQYGHCRDLDAVRFTYTPQNGPSQVLYLSNYMITYWDAQNFCAALGKTLSVDASELIEGYNGEQSGSFTPTDLARRIATLRNGIFVMPNNTAIRESDGNIVYISISTSGSVGASARKNGGARALCR